MINPTKTLNAEYPVAAIVLAAGRSTRMQDSNKLLARLDGIPLVKRVVSAVTSSHIRQVIVVTGHEHERIERALSDCIVSIVFNPDYADGLSTSLRTGLAALSSEVDGVLVCLADMPWLRINHINRLIAHYDPAMGCAICVPTLNGQHGNPVLWSKEFFPEMSRLTGDTGARKLIEKYHDRVCEIDMDDDAVLIDIDTPQDFKTQRTDHRGRTFGTGR